MMRIYMQNFPLSPRDTEGDIFILLSHKTPHPQNTDQIFQDNYPKACPLEISHHE